MAAVNPNGLDAFLRGEPLDVLAGPTATGGFDYFLRGEPFVGAGDAGTAVVAGTTARTNRGQQLLVPARTGGGD